MQSILASENETAENVKEKREAPIAEPSIDFLPPRPEAPYYNFTPLVKTLNFASSNSNPTYYVPEAYEPTVATPEQPFPSQAPYSTATTFPSSLGYGNSEQLVAPINSNELGNGYLQSTQSFSTFNVPQTAYRTSINHPAYSSGKFNNVNNVNGHVNSYGVPTSTLLNRLNNGASPVGNNYGNVYRYAGGNSFTSDPNNQQLFGNNALNGGSSFGFGSGYSNGPTSAALISNQSPQLTVTKGLGHYGQSFPVSNLNTQQLKNSRPIALQAPHQVRKPQPAFIGSDNNNKFYDNNNPFKPSAFLGSQVLSSTPEYAAQIGQQPTLSSLGTFNQYFPPEQYLASQQSREYLPPAQIPANYPSNYKLVLKPPSTSYGIPDNRLVTYSRSDSEPSLSELYGVPYGQPQPIIQQQ